MERIALGHADDAEFARTANYPHLVVRIYSAVYQREPIQIRRGPPAVGIHNRATYVQHLEPFVDGKMSESCRALLLAGIQEAVRRLKFRMCIVWSPGVCTYVEEGETVEGVEPPSGGLTLPRPIDMQTGKTMEDEEVSVEQMHAVIH